MPPTARRSSLFRSVAACALLVSSMSFGAADADDGKLQTGEAPPTMRWSDLRGGEHDWSELRADETLVVLFWATWCATCRREWPKLIELAVEFEQDGLSVRWATIGVGSEPTEAERALAKRGNLGLALVDPEEKGFEALGLKYVPTIFVLDREGLVSYAGAPSIKKLRHAVERAASSNSES